jgi:hypothetical protein
LIGAGAALPARLLLEHPRAADLYPRYLAAGYHVTCGMLELMGAALARARGLAPDDAVAAGLVPYLERHLVEEMHHEDPGGALLEDIAALGLEAQRLAEEAASPKTASLIAAVHGKIARGHPVAVLGFLELEAFHTEMPTVELLIERTGLPRAGFRQLLLHAKLDRVHADELHRVIDSLPLEPRHEQLIGLCAVLAIGTVAEVLVDVVSARETAAV